MNLQAHLEAIFSQTPSRGSLQMTLRSSTSQPTVTEKSLKNTEQRVGQMHIGEKNEIKK